MTFLIGAQGWTYSDWQGPLYAHGLSSDAMLAAYSDEFDTVEVNDTFFGLPPEHLMKRWKELVSSSFVFSLTVPQQITHDRRLVHATDLLARFVDRARILDGHLGPLLLKFSPDFVATPENRVAFEEFLPSLDRELRWAIEFRHASWMDVSILTLLRRRGIALVLADGRWFRRSRLFDLARDPTARFLYIRWMDQGVSYTHCGSVQHARTDVLTEWAKLIHAITGRFEMIYGYFNNRFEGYAPQSIKSFQHALANQSSGGPRVASKK